MQERRPCDGDHTQHPSGTAEQDTLRTWVFQLTQVSQWERRRWNGKVERSAEKVLFNTWFPKVQVCGRRLAATHDRLRNAVGNLFKGKEHMKHHESNQKSGQRVQKFIGQVHNAASRIASPRADSVFVGQCLSVVHCPPA